MDSLIISARWTMADPADLEMSTWQVWGAGVGRGKGEIGKSNVRGRPGCGCLQKPFVLGQIREFWDFLVFRPI